MNRKLLFFDIDGTLLCGKLPGYIPESALDALGRAQDKGHYVFINTGRTWAYLPQAVKDYPFDGYICGCGTYIRFHDEVLYHHRIPDDIRMSLPGLLKGCRLQGVLEGTGAMYADRKVDPFPPIQMVCDAYKVYSNDTAKDFDDEDLLFEKFVIIGDSSGDADRGWPRRRRSAAQPGSPAERRWWGRYRRFRRSGRWPSSAPSGRRSSWRRCR